MLRKLCDCGIHIALGRYLVDYQKNLQERPKTHTVYCLLFKYPLARNKTVDLLT